ncbi:LOB domain-containing protein 22 [Tanacetum coccineum]
MITALQNLKDQEQRDEAMRTMIYEANVRAKDMVGGCYRIMLQLAKQINVAKRELAKILAKVDHTRRQEAMRSMIYEANVRAKDPVMGCCRIIRELDQQVREAENELAFVKQLLVSYKPADYGVQNQIEMINVDEEFSLKDLNDLRAAFDIEDLLADQDDHQNGR